MSKVYLHDEATGVTVSQTNLGDVHIQTADTGHCYVTPAEFRAVIEGGLRWMLENDGEDAVYDFANKVTRAWLKGNGR